MGIRNKKSFGWILVGFLAGIMVSLGITAAAQKAEPLPLKGLQQFANVYGAIKASYVEPVADQQLINDAIRGLFADLDPHSLYLDEDGYKQMQDITRGGFGGLGIEIGTQDNMPKVIAPIEDTPAARAGILTGDLITQIDGQPTKDLSLNEAVKKMRGEPGTSIDLTVQRVGSPKPLKFHIVREIIKTQSVRGEMLANGIAYVRISQFQERTTADLIKLLADFSKKQAPKGLILDLRNDPGGLLNAAIGVTSVFIDPGKLVVSTKGRIPSSNEEFYARAPNRDHGVDINVALPTWTRSVPMVVLVNIGSASASEIVAGALQDYKRAQILGNRTFGKGSVQSLLQLSEDTGIKLTTARYYTPSGRSIQNTGVMPDHQVDDSAAGNLFHMQREVDLRHHLGDQAEDADPAVDADAVADDFVPGEIKMFKFGGEDDWQLQQAINALQGRPVLKSDPVLVRQARAAAGVADAAQASPAPLAEKKTLNDGGAQGPVDRYRVTPDGLIKVQ
ncbi:S41 family peptidase [Castellaniella sp.]|uniref:S41 family peptidase n=1 Tax=Castellaniella sp. TaxID=1955812 RepID=UPI002AFE96F0|nr:S41 family peptidase [Castellaniella sp.]